MRVHDLIGKSPLLHRYKKRIWNNLTDSKGMLSADRTGLVAITKESANKAYRESSKVARKVMKQMHDTPVDIDRAYANFVRAPVATMQAMSDMKDGHGGIRAYVRGQGRGRGKQKNQVLLGEQWETLRKSFPNLPETPPVDGDEVLVFSKTYESIKQQVEEEDWEEFEQSVMDRAAVERFRAAGHRYPGIEQDSPADLEKEFGRQFEAHPEWDRAYEDLKDYMDSLLVLGVLGGRHTVGEAITIKEKWEHYAPLQRQVEATGGKRSALDIDPDIGVYGARGSEKEFRALDSSVHQRTKQAFDFYYHNQFIGSLADLSRSLERNKDISYETRTALGRTMIPMRLETTKAATLSDLEQREVIADGVNRAILSELGVDTDDMRPEQVAAEVESKELEAATADTITFMIPGKPIFRSKKPTVQVVTRWKNGQAHYLWVPDPVMFTMLASVGEPHKSVRLVERLFKGLTDPWKRNITQTFGFTVRNLPRDATTAMMLSDDHLLPGTYAAVAVLERAMGTELSEEARSPTELLSKALDATTTKAHKTRVDTFKDVLAEGVVVPGFMGMSGLERASVLPGMGMSAALKPWELFNYATGSRALSELGESVTREGAFIAERKRGGSSAKARERFDKSSGFFAQRQGSPTWRSVLRVAGFVNPSLQITYQMYESFSHPDPKVRAEQAMVKSPWLVTMGAITAAASYGLMRLMAGDDEEELELMLDSIREQSEAERLGHMHIGGVLRVPFDYGPSGALMSTGYNYTLDWIIDAPNDKEREKRAMNLLSRGIQLPFGGGFDMASSTENVRELSELVLFPLPPHVKSAGELTWNHSLWWNSDIVPDYMIRDERPPEDRAYWSTPEVYKWTGKTFGVSPLKVQYATRNLLSGAVDDTVKFLDKQQKGSATWKDLPTFRGLLLREETGRHTRSVKTIEDLSSDYTTTMHAIEANLGNIEGDEYKDAMDRVISLKTSHEAMREVNRLV